MHFYETRELSKIRESGLGKSLDTSHGSSENESMDVRLALVGLDNPQVGSNSSNVVLVGSSVTAKDLHQSSSVSKRSITVLSLDHRDELRRAVACVLESTDLDGGNLAVGDIGESIGKLLLDELVLGQRLALELLSLESVLSSEGNGLLEGTHGTPGNAVSGRVEACEGTLESGDLGEHVLHGDLNVVHLNHTGNRCTESGLVLDGRGGEAGLDLGSLHEEASDLAVELTPHNHEVGDGRVCDPVLGTGEHEHALLGRMGLGHGLHGAGVGAVVGLSEAETADELTRCETGQESILLFLGAKLLDGMHDEGRLDRHGGSVAGVDSLNLSGDETVGNRGHARASVALDGGAEKTNLTHLLHDVSVKVLGSVALENLGVELGLAKVSSSISHGDLLLGEQGVELERVLPVHGGGGTGHGGGGKATGSSGGQSGELGEHCDVWWLCVARKDGLLVLIYTLTLAVVEFDPGE